jgi:hypothetical protein
MMLEATIIVRLCGYTRGSQFERILLDIEGPGVALAPIDVTDKMGKTVSFRVPADTVLAYGIRVERPNAGDMYFAKTTNFVVSGPQEKLPITQFVRDAICSAIVQR